MTDLRNYLQESHKDIMQWFLLHQECLLLGDDSQAKNAFEIFSDYLSQHMDFEDTLVIPAFEKVEENLNFLFQKSRKLQSTIRIR